jgi:lipopolysaccharide/colanic/teichoic acid biosynthesis glycosyltransferase
MSFKEEFVHPVDSGAERYEVLSEAGGNAYSCTLSLAYHPDEKSSHLDSWSFSFRKKWKKISLAFFHFLREHILSTLFLLGFLLWNLIIPQEKKGQSLLMYAYERMGRLAKRSLDVIGATISLILTLPLFLVIAILIKLDSPGPVIFKQERVGQNRRQRERRNFDSGIEIEKRKGNKRKFDCFGKPFEVYKFRTMVDNAEKICGPVWAKKDDPRITSVGRILRRTRLDELPQVMNVLKGEMSLVGPRPERYFFIKNLANSVQHYPRRLSVKPGITGLAQVKNGYDSDVDDVRVKIVYDLDYIRDWSLLKDLKILAQTVVVMLTGRGAF